MGAAGWPQGGPKQDLHRFWINFESHVYQFFEFKMLEIICSDLFPGHVFFIDFCTEILMLETSKSMFSQGKYYKEMFFLLKSF